MNANLERLIEQVLDVAIDKVIGSDTTLTRRGSNLVGVCPFCGGGSDTPPFTVFQKTNSCKCFSCLEGGNVISYTIKRHNLPFLEAVKKIARENNIVWDEKECKQTEGEVREGRKREAARILMQQVADYYVQNLKNDPMQNKYVRDRWEEKIPLQYSIGYAKDSWDDLLKHAKASGWNLELLEELGMLNRKDKSDHVYDAFRGRIMIPIRDRWGNIIAFTGRDTTKQDKVAKYMNNKENFMYSKGKTLFGIDRAYVLASKERKAYVMEGAPDVIRMDKISVSNSVAPLGTAFTSEQFALLKKMNVETLCFIPDQDEPGLRALNKNAMNAIRNGFGVSVKNIPTTAGVKEDADSYFKNIEMFAALPEEDYIVLYAKSLLKKDNSISENNQHLEEIAAILSWIPSEGTQESYVTRLTKIYGKANVWKKAIAQCNKDAITKETRKKGSDIELLQKYGFLSEHNCYFSLNDNGQREQWSNFVMTPLFHIKDTTNPKRMYAIKNCFNYEHIIEMKQEELVSMNKFKMKLEGLGNFIWEAGERELIKLKKFLYEKTETAKEVTQLGWQKTGNFYAFGNGGFDGKNFIRCNEYGIIKMETGNYYLPSASKIYREEENLFQFERRFVHDNNGSISLYDYAVRMIAVYGDNAKIGLCFLMATLFKDIVVRQTKSFPILNLFGPKGAGKSEMGHSLMSFFIPKNTAPNLTNATIPALGDVVAQCSNALVHLDEFKNSVDMDKREFLKGLWDNTGRSRMNMDKDKKREITNVDSGVIVSGQEMATADIALFSRFVFLCFTQTEYNDEERNRFQELKNIEGLGLSHLTLQILRLRREMSLNFNSIYNECATDVSESIKQRYLKVEDRIYRNWLILVATFKTLHEFLTLPFSYDEIRELCVDMMIRQNKECKSNNELSGFWSMISYLNQSREIYLNADFKIRAELNLQLKGGRTIENKFVKQYLYIRKDRIFQLYQYHSKLSGVEKPIDKTSLIFYLLNSPEFVGEKQSVRFKNITKGIEEKKMDKDNKLVSTTGIAQAMIFDYDLIKRNYDIDLDTYDESDEEMQDEQPQKPKENMPF